MAFWDQRMRFRLIDRTRAIDERNTRRLRAIIESHGWPGSDLVGEQAADAAWLLVQHSDHDAAFQQRCLELMREAAARGVASTKNLAYLEDRVRIASGRPQLYGTQLERRGGRLAPTEIEDPEHVDERRAQVGLGPLAEYLADTDRLQLG
jgi:hypothetical protein